MTTLWYKVAHVQHKDMAQLRKECIDGNERYGLL